MKVQVACVAKLRDNSGAIKSYVLQDQNGQQIEVKRLQLLEMMHYPHYDFINLKLSVDGKIIDKTEDTTPEVKRTLIPQDYAAALFRSNYETKGKTKEQIKTVMQSVLQTELATGQVSMSTLGSLSDSLERVANIGGWETPSLSVTGYLLRNIGNTPIPYKRIDTESGQESMSVIQPGKIGALTTLETVTLLMDARFSFKIHNAKMCLGSSMGLGRYEDMLNCYLYKLSNQDAVRNVQYTELPESERARFSANPKFRNEKVLAGQIKNNKDARNASKPNNRDARNASKPRTVFNMF